MHRLIVDTSNILFRVAAANNKHNGSAEDLAGLSMHSSLNTLKSFYRKVAPDQMAVAFEGKQNWRKTYTNSPECVSKRGYKANRVKGESMVAFYELIGAFEGLVREHTSLVALSHPELEGDDMIGGYAQYYAAKGDDVTILSGDKDFVQLLKNPRIKLLNPDDGKYRTIEDPEYFMFEKAIRGDAGDNVMSAYPRVRSTRILKAFTDEYERTNMFNETWEFCDPTTGEKRTYRVGDLFEENQLLMNLERQPAHIREKIIQTIEHEAVHTGKFSLFHFVKFCGKFQLKKIADTAEQFAEMFSASGIRSPHKEETKRVQEAKKIGTIVF